MAAANFQLVSHTGPNQGKVAPLEKAEIFIGRDLTNDIVINDAEVSRRHARLVLQAGGYVLEDLGSTNGTFVNGNRLMGPYILRVGDIITLGEHISLGFEPITFDPDATMASAAARPGAMPSEPAPVRDVYTAPPPKVPVSSPPGSYSGQVPDEYSYEAPPRRRPGVVLGVVIGSVLLIACVCAVALWVIDTNLLWCTLFPFIPGCP